MADKTCSKCHRTKPIEAFHNDSSTSDGKTRWCAQCRSSKSAHWARANRWRCRVVRIARQYGLTPEVIKAMWVEQRGCCAICRRALVRGGNTRLSAQIDHDHRTGRVRALLCQDCNVALGLFREDESCMLLAVGYLRRHRLREVG